jgi:chromosome segregation ATPase
MEPHSHPDYERILTTVAELLDRLAESDIAARARMDGMQAEASKRYEEFDKRLDRISIKLEDISTKVESISAKLEEATDKTNALLDLMDRHLKEPHPRQ